MTTRVNSISLLVRVVSVKMEVRLAISFTTTAVSFVFITVVILLCLLVVESVIRLSPISVAQQLVALAVKAQLLVTVSFTSLVCARRSSLG